jgi:alanyl-tRNA synthetase
MALFGEKYGEVVRVVNVQGWSTEFCGGTHVQNTAQIGAFKILSEASAAAGIRRIEAVTGANVMALLNEDEKTLKEAAAAAKVTNQKDLPGRVAALVEENKALGRALEELKAKAAASKVGDLFRNAVDVQGVKIVTAFFSGTAPETLRSMSDSIRDKAPDTVCVLVGSSGDKLTMTVAVAKNALQKGLKAGVLVKEIAAIAGGNGGGKPDFAMAGLRDATKVDEALNAVPEIVKKALG